MAELSLRTVVMAAVITGLVIGVGAGFAQDRWSGVDGPAATATAVQPASRGDFQGEGNLDPADFIGLADAEGGAAALESFISSGFGAGGPDPDFLRARIRQFGIQVSDDATTEEMLEMLASRAEELFPAPAR